MNCHNCQKRIRTPKPDYSVAELIDLLRPKCVSCDPNEMPRGGRSQVELTDFTASKRKVDPCSRALEPAESVDSSCVGVSPEAFGRLRTAMTSLFALDPLDLLIIQHIVNGGAMADFPKVYVDLMTRCSRYRGSARQMVYARKRRIEEALPQLKPVFGHLMTGSRDRRPTE